MITVEVQEACSPDSLIPWLSLKFRGQLFSATSKLLNFNTNILCARRSTSFFATIAAQNFRSLLAMASLDVPIRPRPTGGQKTTKAVILVSFIFQNSPMAIVD